MSQDIVGRPMEILLVEDSLTSARLTMGALKAGGIQHRLTWLSDGMDAVAFLKRAGKYSRAPRPDLVLLDLELPGRDGRDLLADVKSDEDLSKIPIVVLTSSTAPSDQQLGEEYQVDGYLTKPVDFQRFLALVRELERFWHADMILIPRDDK